MSLISFPAKLLACLVAAFGVTGSPYIYSASGLIHKEKKRKSLTLGKFNFGESKLSLNGIDSVEKLLRGSVNKLTFKQLGMKWGHWELKEKDILFTPCQDGDYYLMRYQREYHYLLDDGTAVSLPLNCWEKEKYENLKYVKLDWARHTLGSVTLSQITLGSCSLSRYVARQGNDTTRLILTCHAYQSGGETIRGVFGENDYEYE